MSTFDAATTFVTKVSIDRTVRLPDAIPDGATVAVIVLPPAWRDDEELRQAHFAAALAEIRAACSRPPPPPSLSDQELNQLIRKLRKQMSST